MKVITVINDQGNLGFQLLRLSCNFNRLELIVLISREKEFTSNKLKDKLLRNYLSGLADPEEIILFTDGYDTVLMAEEEEILTKFFRFGKDLIFSAEANCWPDPGLSASYPESTITTRYRYLNSGGFIGRVGVIRDLLDDDSLDTTQFDRSNQYLWARKYLQYPQRIFLDTECELFQTFSTPEGNKYYLSSIQSKDLQPCITFMKKWFSDNFIIHKDRIHCKITQNRPCHVHFNGPSKFLVDNDIFDMVLAMSTDYKATRFIYEENNG